MFYLRMLKAAAFVGVFHEYFGIVVTLFGFHRRRTVKALPISPRVVIIDVVEKLATGIGTEHVAKQSHTNCATSVCNFELFCDWMFVGKPAGKPPALVAHQLAPKSKKSAKPFAPEPTKLLCFQEICNWNLLPEKSTTLLASLMS